MLWRLLMTHLRPYRWALAAVIGLQFLGTVALLWLPSLNAEIIDDGIVTGDIGLIWNRGAVMLAIAFAQAATAIAAVWFSARTAMAFGRDLRARLFDHINGFSAREVTDLGAPSLITRTTNDVQQVQMVVLMGGTVLVAAPIMMIGGVVMSIREDVGLSWLVAVVVPVMAALVGFVVSRLVPSFRRLQGRIDEVNRVLREQITGIRVVRAFVREEHEEERFAVANDDLTAVSISAGRWMASLFPIVMLVSNVATVGVIWFGGHRVESGAMEVGAITAYISYVMQIVMSVMMATFMFMILPRAAVCAERITEVLQTSSSVVAPEHGVTAFERPGHVQFDKVGFSYPGAAEPVLSEVSLEVRPGETLAVIGSTGSGKTSLVNLVPRLADATNGRVLVGGIDVRELDVEALWGHLGLVPQKAFLFTGTVADNLRYGKADATESEMWQALETAQVRQVVEEMPGGLDAEIAQGGSNVSGGQRQRLAIARALIRRPAVLLFDDSFSALDVATDARLRAALSEVTGQTAVIVVAQRVATIRDADRIAVLEGGRIVGLGSHDELLNACETYREIVESQKSGAMA